MAASALIQKRKGSAQTDNAGQRNYGGNFIRKGLETNFTAAVKVRKEEVLLFDTGL